MKLSRRELLIGSTAAIAMRGLPLRAAEAPTGAAAVLAEIAESLRRDFPEQATVFVIDKGARAPLRSRLVDRSAAGQHAIAKHLSAQLARLRTLDESSMSEAERLDAEVTRTAFELALEGFAFPYGD